MDATESKYQTREAIVDADAAYRAAKLDLIDAVRTARMAGNSWAEVGEALDISRQAAHERFAAATGT